MDVAEINGGFCSRNYHLVVQSTGAWISPGFVKELLWEQSWAVPGFSAVQDACASKS